MDATLLQALRERGLLLEKDVFEILNSFPTSTQATQFIDQLARISGQKLITKHVITNHATYVKSVMQGLAGEQKQVFDNVLVKLGISLEVQHIQQVVTAVGNPSQVTTSGTVKRVTTSIQIPGKKTNTKYQLFYADTRPSKKLEVGDFTGYFRARYSQLQRILMQRPELQANLISINKISSERSSMSIIGIVTEKRITKNKNLIITVEDLTGKIGVLVKPEKGEVFQKAEELQLDDVIGIKASGSSDILFCQDILFPEAFVFEKARFEEDVSVAFISDIHAGSQLHLEEEMGRFLEWINSDDEVAKSIRYIFIVGDNVDGVGIFPGQEKILKLKSMKEQYGLLASYLKKIPPHITMFMCPGQHDAVRVAEPQPLIDKRYAPQLYDIENLVLVTNPTLVKLQEGEKEFKVLMYHGASIHSFINEIKELRIMKAHNCPAKAVMHMLKRRHLSPTHGEVVYIPNADVDPLVINEVPDVLCTGEVHHLDIENYHGILIITGSCWQSQTPFEEKVGNIPIPGKVPVLNLKTRALRIYDFMEDKKSDEQ